MMNYIKAEFYKLLRRKVVITIYLSMVILLVLMRIGISVAGEQLEVLGITGKTVIDFSYLILIGINALILLFIPIFTDDIKNGTMKNLITTDLKIKNVFLGKIIVQAISALILLTIFLPLLIIIVTALPTGNGYEPDALFELIYKILLAIPCYVTSLLVADYLALLIRNEIIICLAYYYGYIQVFALMVFVATNTDNVILSACVLPMQMSRLFSEKLSLQSGAISCVTGIAYLFVALLALTKQLDKNSIN
ncbi:MAG: ABC transporter permease [Lachnospiraceae bacterium]|nr:ABC transporter permease [Lachnospiraceae bacterium]